MRMETIANVVRILGLVVTLVGLWFSAGGLRVVVSGRIDERRRSANSLKRGLPLVVLGLVLLVLASWI
jgi:hypothetical protein